MDVKALEKATAKWIKLLGLENWYITVTMVTPEDKRLEFSDNDDEEPTQALGVTSWDYDMLMADVFLADDTAYHPKGIEFTLAHELGHVAVNPIVEREDGLEQLINVVVYSVMRGLKHEPVMLRVSVSDGR